MWNSDFPLVNLSVPPSGSGRLEPSDHNLVDPFIDVDFFSSLMPTARDPTHKAARGEASRNPDEIASSSQADLTTELANGQSRPSKQARSTEIKLSPDPRSRNMLAQRAYRRRVKVILHLPPGTTLVIPGQPLGLWCLWLRSLSRLGSGAGGGHVAPYHTSFFAS